MACDQGHQIIRARIVKTHPDVPSPVRADRKSGRELAFFASGWLMYGILFVSSGAVPPVLGWWAVVASLLAVVGRWLALVSPDVGLVAISFVPIMLFEVVFGIWLLFQGGQIGPP